MTEEEINETIAEHCGKKIISLPFIPKKITVDDNTVFTRAAQQQWYSVYPTGATVDRVPNYCKDLNAMHEAEKTLDYEQADDFWDCLCDATAEENDVQANPFPWRFARTHATARQRAEAFLRTLDKWEK
jgi:hypothetical protein